MRREVNGFKKIYYNIDTTLFKPDGSSPIWLFLFYMFFSLKKFFCPFPLTSPSSFIENACSLTPMPYPLVAERQKIKKEVKTNEKSSFHNQEVKVR